MGVVVGRVVVTVCGCEGAVIVHGVVPGPFTQAGHPVVLGQTPCAQS